MADFKLFLTRLIAFQRNNFVQWIRQGTRLIWFQMMTPKSEAGEASFTASFAMLKPVVRRALPHINLLVSAALRNSQREGTHPWQFPNGRFDLNQIPLELIEWT